jgi:hypothetical protein
MEDVFASAAIVSTLGVAAFFAGMWIRRINKIVEEVVTREELREHIDSLNQINLRDIKIAVVEAQKSCQENKQDMIERIAKVAQGRRV